MIETEYNRKLETEICEALGFNPSDVYELDIHFKAGEVARAEAKVFIKTPGNLRSVIKKFKFETTEYSNSEEAINGNI